MPARGNPAQSAARGPAGPTPGRQQWNQMPNGQNIMPPDPPGLSGVQLDMPPPGLAQNDANVGALGQKNRLLGSENGPSGGRGRRGRNRARGGGDMQGRGGSGPSSAGRQQAQQAAPLAAEVGAVRA